MFNGTNSYKYAEVLEAKTPQELARKLKAIRTPIRVIGFDNDGKKFYAYLNAQRKIKIGE